MHSKTETFTFRIDADIKRRVMADAAVEDRTIAGQINHVLREYYDDAECEETHTRTHLSFKESK